MVHCCCSRVQSQIGHGFFVSQSKPTNPFPLLFNTTQPCLHLRLNRSTALSFLLQCLRPSSSSRKSPNPVSATEYLLRSLDLSPNLSLKIEKRKPVELKSISNADSVVALFRDRGFSDTQIATILSLRPDILSYDPHWVLLPKFDFLAENGISGDDLLRILTREPTILARSLRRIIAPCFDFLLSFSGDSGSVVSFLSDKRGTWFLPYFSDSTSPNVASLRRIGVPDPHILRLLLLKFRAVSRDTDSFSVILKEVTEMGFDPRSKTFLYGLNVYSTVKKHKWESKMEMMKSNFGWSEKEVVALFVKQPMFMAMSEERLKERVELFMERLEWNAVEIARYASLLYASLETKIHPRLCVLEIVISKGLRKRSCIGTALRTSEGKFLEEFVVRYEQDMPELLEIYSRNKMNFKDELMIQDTSLDS